MDTGFPLWHCTATSGRKSEHISERALRVSNDVSIQVYKTEWSFPTPSHASSAPSSPDVSGPVAGRENSSQSNNKGHTSINYWHERKIFKAVSWIYYQRGTDSRWKQGKPTMTETSTKILKKHTHTQLAKTATVGGTVHCVSFFILVSELKNQMIWCYLWDETRKGIKWRTSNV